jgi:hypothetical protein
MLIIRNDGDQGPDVDVGRVTGTLTGRYAISIVFPGGVITLDHAEATTILPGLRHFVQDDS